MGHKERVSLFSIALCQAMGLPKERVAVIARGAFLHDIGKMAIPHAILLKPGSLNAEETATMQEHPYRGYQIVRSMPVGEEAAEIVYTHHERYDGTGYPRGIKGKEIPLGARIVAVVNTLDSITTNLPYRPASSLSAARIEIEKWSGRQFDPEIVRLFLEIPDGVWEDLRLEADSAKENDMDSPTG